LHDVIEQSDVRPMKFAKLVQQVFAIDTMSTPSLTPCDELKYHSHGTIRDATVPVNRLYLLCGQQ
jgi:hypothetical protein